MPQAKVYFVGAGPGDPGLITARGLSLITEADCIIYDHLIPMELLETARDDTELISVGKFAGSHTMSQDQINHLLVEKASEGKNVVRLKGGTPFLFGRGGEEAQACTEADIAFEVIPGVTSAIGGATYAGIPVTHRDYTSDVAIVTGHRRDDRELVIPDAGTLVFLMSVANIGKIVSQLLESGRSPGTPIAAVENATCYNQRVITGTLADFSARLTETAVKTPAMFIVGRVVQLRDTLDWFGKRPRILLPGTHPEKYRHLGIIVHRPLIRLEAIDDYTEADKILGRLSDFNWLVFSSTNGVRFFFERLDIMGRDSRAINGLKIAAIGVTTAETLRGYGIMADLVPSDESSRGLFEEFSKGRINATRFLLVKPVVGSPELFDNLTAEGAVVETVAVYKSVEIEPEPVDFAFIDRVLFTSGSTVRAFMRRYGKVPENVTAFCLGPPTLHEAEKHGIKTKLLP